MRRHQTVILRELRDTLGEQVLPADALNALDSAIIQAEYKRVEELANTIDRVLPSLRALLLTPKDEQVEDNVLKDLFEADRAARYLGADDLHNIIHIALTGGKEQ